MVTKYVFSKFVAHNKRAIAISSEVLWRRCARIGKLAGVGGTVSLITTLSIVKIALRNSRIKIKVKGSMFFLDPSETISEDTLYVIDFSLPPTRNFITVI